jgi:hypothetical protein
VKADTNSVQVLAGAIGSQQFSFGKGVFAGGGTIDVDPITSSALIAVIRRDTTGGVTTYLIIATGEMENTGQSLEQHATNPELWRVETWAQEPFEVRVEGIGSYIILPVSAGNVTFHSLNPDGSENTELDVDELENYCGLRLSVSNQTLWYKVVITS